MTVKLLAVQCRLQFPHAQGMFLWDSWIVVLSHWTESIPKAWLQNMSQSWSRQDGPLWKHTALWPMAPGCCSLDSVIVMAYFTLATFPALLWHVSRGRMLGCVLNCSLHSQRQTGQPKDTNKDRRSRQHGDPPPHTHTHTHNARWLLTFLLQLACSLKGILHLILHSTYTITSFPLSEVWMVPK